MNMFYETQESQIGALSVPEAQAEVFWLAFQSLPDDVQRTVRQRLLHAEEMPEALATELASWQAAVAEALMNFEALLYEAQ